MKNEPIDFLGRPVVGDIKCGKKLKTDESSTIEKEIAKRLHATVKVKHEKLNEGKYSADNENRKSNVIRGIQSKDGKLLKAEDDEEES